MMVFVAYGSMYLCSNAHVTTNVYSILWMEGGLWGMIDRDKHAPVYFSECRWGTWGARTDLNCMCLCVSVWVSELENMISPEKHSEVKNKKPCWVVPSLPLVSFFPSPTTVLQWCRKHRRWGRYATPPQCHQNPCWHPLQSTFGHPWAAHDASPMLSVPGCSFTFAQQLWNTCQSKGGCWQRSPSVKMWQTWW